MRTWEQKGHVKHKTFQCERVKCITKALFDTVVVMLSFLTQLAKARVEFNSPVAESQQPQPFPFCRVQWLKMNCLQDLKNEVPDLQIIFRASIILQWFQDR